MNFWSLLLKILGWKIYGENFISPRSVIAVAPHTSYLDGVIGFIAMKAMKIKFRTISAERLFFFPFKYVMKFALNAIPCGPRSGNSIRVATKMFKENDDVNLVICPEGHLKAVDKWSKGFYVIAKMSCVPINIAVLNFKKKEIHIFGPFDTKDFDIDTMFREINEDVEMFGEARHPEKYLPHSLPMARQSLRVGFHNFEDCDVNES